MTNLKDIDGMIEIDESELGTSIDVSSVQRALDDTGTSKKDPIQTGNAEGRYLEVDEEMMEESEELTDDPEEQPNPQDTAEDEDYSPADTFRAFAVLLKENGALPNVEDEELQKVDSAAAILSVLNKQLHDVNKVWQENYKRNVLKNLINDGYITEQQVVKGLPKSYNPDDIKKDEKVAMETIRSFYRSKEIPDQQIETIIKNTLDLEEEALRLLPYIEEMKEKENQRIAEQIRKKEQEEVTQKQVFEKSLKDNVFAVKEFVPGRTLSDVDKEVVFKNIVPVLNKINGDLGKYAPILSYLDKYGLLEGDMTKIMNEVTSKKTSDFEKLLSNKKKSTSSGGNAANAQFARKKTGYNIYG